MQDYDFTTPTGKQAFQHWVTQIIRNEVNSIVRQVLFERNTTNITTPTTSDINPNSDPQANYTLDEIQNLRLDRLEEATFRR